MHDIEPHIINAIHELSREGLPVEQIAFMMRVGPQLITEILAVPVEVEKFVAKPLPKPTTHDDKS